MIPKARGLATLVATGLLLGCAQSAAPENRIDAAHSHRLAYPAKALHDGLMGAAVGFCAVAPDGASRCHLAYNSDPVFAAPAQAFLAGLRFGPGAGDAHRKITIRFVTSAAHRLGYIEDDGTIILHGKAGTALKVVRYDCLVGLDAFVHDCAPAQTDTPDAIASTRIALAHLPQVPDFEGEQPVARRRVITMKVVPPGMDPDNPFN